MVEYERGEKQVYVAHDADTCISDYGSDGRPPGCCGKGCCWWGRTMRGLG